MVLKMKFLSIMGREMFIRSFTHSADILFIYFIYLFFLFDCAGSSCCARSFFSCSEQGTTLSLWRMGLAIWLFCCRTQALGVQAQQLWLSGLFAPLHLGSSSPDHRSKPIPCTGRWTHNHWTIKEVPQQRFIEEQPWARLFAVAGGAGGGGGGYKWQLRSFLSTVACTRLGAGDLVGQAGTWSVQPRVFVTWGDLEGGGQGARK